MSDPLTQGRSAFEKQSWEAAYTQLSKAGDQDELSARDFEMLAKTAHLTGRHEKCEEFYARAHSSYLEDGEAERAAECAFWVGFRLMHAGQHARGSGWLARSQRVVEDAGIECAAQGLLILPSALRALSQSDAESAYEQFGRAAEIGHRFHHADLLTLARLGQGQALVRMDKSGDGVTLLDEVMVDVTAGEASPIIVGIVYCAVIDACHEIFDLRRAREWTAAFSRWCAPGSDIVPFRGECLVRRAEIMQVHGRWSDALDEASRAGRRLSEPPGQRAAGAAFYRQAELHRLRGEFGEAEKAFREAERWGRSSLPGRALLRLAQGQKETAASEIRRAVAEAGHRRIRSNLLPAYVEILLEVGDVPEAREGSDELSAIADALDAPYLRALAGYAHGAVLLAEERPRDAVGVLREALTTFRELGAPFEAARALMQIGLACRALGDADSCRVEIEEARAAFERLDAAPELARLDERDLHFGNDRKDKPDRRSGLTPRELEVLGLVATGKTNRAIAEDLFISEKTVARHVSNIFNKLGVSSRAAATAYAYEHDLL